MKTLPLLTIIAAVSALVLLPFVLEITATALFAAGLMFLVVSDYSRRPTRLPLGGTPALAVATRTERFGLAA